MKIEVFLENGEVREFDKEPFWRTLQNTKIKEIHCDGFPLNLGKRCAIIFQGFSILGGPTDSFPILITRDDEGFWRQCIPNGIRIPYNNSYNEIMVDVV